MKKLLPLTALFLVSVPFACGEYPTDPEHTHEEDYVEGWNANAIMQGL